tara:strand:- start:3675 stop:4049 length:375 start_codon:yes stop_codon:yes gene_type:complete
MSTAERSKTIEIAAIAIGALAIAASAYFIFMTEGNAFKMTNWVISLAFVVFVAYNFVNVRNLKGELNELSDKNNALTENLQVTKQNLAQAQSDVEVIKADLVSTQNDLRHREKELEVLRTQKEQ